MDFFEILKYILWIIGALALGALLYAMVMLALIMRTIKRIAARIELLTDIKGWWDLIRKLGKFCARK